MIRATVRTARKRRLCDDCRRSIEPGQRYIEHVTSPWHDDLDNTHWWRLIECADCGERYGRSFA